MFHNSQDSIIRNLEPLTPDYLPERLTGREKPVDEILQCLTPALARRKPIHVWVCGPSGSGKTAAVRFAVEMIREKSAIPIAYVSGWRHRSFYSVLDALTTGLRVLRAEEQRTAARLQRLEKHLGQDPCIIILDDLDLATRRDREDMIYSLAGIGNVGLICISTSDKPIAELEQRVRVRLNPKAIRLTAYSTGEIATILEERAALALIPGTWDSCTLTQIAKLSEGSAALAVEILRAAAHAAETARVDRITASHIKSAKSDSLEACSQGIVADLSPHHAELYGIIRKHDRISSDTLRKTYAQRCRSSRVAPVARRTYSKYLASLISAGLVRTVGTASGARVLAIGTASYPRHSYEPGNGLSAAPSPCAPPSYDHCEEVPYE